MTRASLQEYAARQREWYQQATRTQKPELLNEIVAVMSCLRRKVTAPAL